MDTQPGQRALERLFAECSERAWRLAYGYLRRPHEAYDVVQQAFLVAASKAERIPPGETWPWFGTVVFNEARNARRRMQRASASLESKDERDDMPAIDERQAPPDEAAERAEARDSLWQAIDALPDVERTAIVLTHISGMTHANAAATLLMPAKTLSSHVSRALSRLRERLSSSEDAVSRRLAAIPIVLPPGGWESAAAAWRSAAEAGLAAAPEAAAETAGATAAGGASASAPASAGATTIAVNKAILAAGFAASLAVGFAGGAIAARTWIAAERGDEAARAATEQLRELGGGRLAAAPEAAEPGANRAAADLRHGDEDAAISAATAARIAELEARIAALAGENEALRAETTALEAELAELASEGSAHGAIFTFGEGGRLDEVQKANWPEMAEASRIVAGAILEYFEFEARGEKPPEQLLLALQENTEKVRKYEYRTIGKLPTAAKYNGELTHPISIANLVASLLVQAELPLSEAQVARISRFGEAYDEGMARVTREFPAGTLRPRRLLEEYLLKGEFTEQLFGQLTGEQRAVVVNPASHREALLDVFSPAVMLVHTSPIVTGTNAEELRTACADLLAARYSLTAEQKERLLPLLAEWIEDVDGLLAPVEKRRARHFTYDEGIVAGRATVSLLAKILDVLELDDAARGKIIDEPGFLIPRITIAEERAEKSA
ncbi:MAG: sigma-70 family RNA polymerase sigma factor [Planctomycetes bacterium]|nr:sigma-70 family RNA polymerase sigma factor [Planctomycetota bacterium]